MAFVIMHYYYDDENYETDAEPIGISFSRASAELFMSEAQSSRPNDRFSIVTVPTV